MTKTGSGKYYHRDWTGRMQETVAVDMPDVVICRRIQDFPGAPPVGACVTPCSRCFVPIAYDPTGPHQDRPHVCMQCSGIEPLPFPQ